MNTNINLLLEEVKKKRLIISRFFKEFPFGWFMRTQYITSISLFFNEWEFTWMVSDCEEYIKLFYNEIKFILHNKAFLS